MDAWGLSGLGGRGCVGGCANTDMPMYIRIGKEHLRCKSVLESQGKPGPVPWTGSRATRRTEPQAGAAGAADGRAQVVQAMP